MSIELLTPVSTAKGEITDLARKTYRKQILPYTKINYGGKEKVFDRAFMEKVKKAFTEGAFPYIPVKLAGDGNAHTDDVLRTGGKLADLELSNEDGLVAVLELNDDGMKAVQDSDCEVGVSVRIFENLVHSDGSRFDAALAHVLVTDDPNVRGMKSWQETALAADRQGVTETIDLSAERFGATTEESMTNKGMVTLEVTEEQHSALLELVAEHEALKDLDLEKLELTAPAATKPKAKAPGSSEEPGEDPAEEADESDTEEEAEDADEAKAKAKSGKKAVNMSRDQLGVLELARADAATARAETLELTRRLRRADVDREVDGWKAKGLAPALVDLARPALDEPAVIELSNGTKTDSASVMRKVLNEILQLASTGHDVIDLNAQSGVLIGGATSQEEVRAGQLDYLRKNYS